MPTPDILKLKLMELLNNKQNRPFTMFLVMGLLLLILGLLLGYVGSLQYILPGFLKKYLSFEKVRALHVSSIVFWILSASSGSVLLYIHDYSKSKNQANKGEYLQFYFFLISFVVILSSYVFGIFGGREYWEFRPVLAFPIFVAWIFFIFNLSKKISSLWKQPVYIWMWLTGAIFFLFTFLESYLWLLPYFSKNLVNDMTIQWKSYGSMVGSWNMLIYGCGIYLMDKINSTNKTSSTNSAFFLYFLGLFNLMFNWGHHIYTLPTAGFIKNISYIVSMTELILLVRIMFYWRKSLSVLKLYSNRIEYRLLYFSELWVLLTLLLAIFMSVPAFNRFSHGTHITVAHTMGATIGINTFILLAVIIDGLSISDLLSSKQKHFMNFGVLLSGGGLFIFWISLLIAGIKRGAWQLSDSSVSFGTMMEKLKPVFFVFSFSGLVLIIGLLCTVIPILIIYFGGRCKS